MSRRTSINFAIRLLLAVLVVSIQSAEAAKSSKWKKRFIQSTQDGTSSTQAALPSDFLTCTDGVVKLNRNLEASTASTDIVSLTFPIKKHSESATIKCSPYQFFNGSSGVVMNSGSVTGTCLNGHFVVTSNCKVATGSEACSIANGTGVSYFDAATDSYGACTVTGCNSGYIISGNTCIVQPPPPPTPVNCTPVITGYQTIGAGLFGQGNVFPIYSYPCQTACSIANGTGMNYNDYAGSPCTPQSCNSGYVLYAGERCVPASGFAPTMPAGCESGASMFYVQEYKAWYECPYVAPAPTPDPGSGGDGG